MQKTIFELGKQMDWIMQNSNLSQQTFPVPRHPPIHRTPWKLGVHNIKQTK